MSRHTPVLKTPVLGAVPPHARRIIDGTVGDAGHAEAILTGYPEVELVGVDADPEAVLRAKKFLHPFGARAYLARESFERAVAVARDHGWDAADFVLLDLGWSMPQFLERGRGFSFHAEDEPLDMRFHPAPTVPTAADIIQRASEEELGDIFRRYGEERDWRVVARALAIERRERPIKTVRDFLRVVESVKRMNKHHRSAYRIHPATLLFQALRIAVNDELGVLERTIPTMVDFLAPGGVCAIISFHSLEDRIVKRLYQSYAAAGVGSIIGPVTASAEEITLNPRARSAKLRILTKQ